MSDSRPIVDLWIWQLETTDRSGHAPPPDIRMETLSHEERQRAGRFVHARDRDRYVRAHIGMRVVLSQYDFMEPASLAFRYGPAGKPFLARPDAPRFNLSHSGSLAALAVSRALEPGLDIEIARDASRAVASVLSVEEKAELDRLPPEKRADAFARAWTRKEAVVKALGTGFETSPEEIVVGVSPDRVTPLVRAPAAFAPFERWRIECFPCGASVIAAIAAAAPDYRIVRRTPPWRNRSDLPPMS
ncbi:4'-phosphopantetheinyl transferase family protein [Pararhizobium mangrovi]|uniref:4'-phosphopantetheinyl transferase superfamily protein n=1 Tax=Pararhizobium mangrovi TaxID=2590452 RepID=A0A506U3Q1_9HYPH|nr:4'-phosphopantetheinyl transferase superfamily protein [Pararhizobium mangrovi]TPW27921.1 4'-phosphopantetheinyl transferase superfamily protein [Pararhizobium mangrovi]